MTDLLTDELTALRAAQTATLPDSAAIRRVTRVSDGAGGTTETEATVATVACRLAMNASGTEREFAERLSLAETATITLPYGTVVLLSDRITVNGSTWRVASISERSWSTALRVIVERVR